MAFPRSEKGVYIWLLAEGDIQIDLPCRTGRERISRLNGNATFELLLLTVSFVVMLFAFVMSSLYVRRPLTSPYSGPARTHKPHPSHSCVSIRCTSKTTQIASSSIIRSHTLPTQQLTRQQRRRKHTPQTHTARKIQHGINPSTLTRIQMLRNQRTHNPKQPAPKTRNPTRRPPDRRRKSFRCPPIQHRIKHALEEILHDIEADITGGAVDAAE
jgi:hypothetical protein